MQVQELMATNLFNDLSDKEQEVVAGGEGYTAKDSGPWGAYERYVDGPNGYFKYTAPNGTVSLAKWGPSTPGGFAYSVTSA